MKGYLETVTRNSVSGWAASKLAGEIIKLRVIVQGEVRAEGTTSTSRPDVLKALNHKNGLPGFKIEVNLEEPDLNKVHVEALFDKKWIKLKKADSKKNKTGGYQDFDGTGASKSHEKLNALRLHDINAGKDKITPLKGKSVLDIGCNEGFFCIEAVKQGASRVVGIDLASRFLELARKRCPEAEFRKATWWDLPDEKFDVIFFLSAIHYEPNQEKLLNKLLNHLTDDGVLVLECGIAPKSSVQDCWTTITRWDGDRRYPNLDYLTNTLLRGYSTRYIGASVKQSGDPIPRAVLHCRPRRPTAILIGGHSHAGKTTIARTLRNSGLGTYQTDVLMTRLVKDPNLAPKVISKALREKFHDRELLNLAEVGRFIIENGLIPDFIDLALSELPLETDTFVVEGEILRHPEVLALLCDRLKEAGVRAWSMTRSN